MQRVPDDYNGAYEVCSECLANRTNRPFTHMRADAVWRLAEQLPWDVYLQGSLQTPVAFVAGQPVLQ